MRGQGAPPPGMGGQMGGGFRSGPPVVVVVVMDPRTSGSMPPCLEVSRVAHSLEHLVRTNPFQYPPPSSSHSDFSVLSMLASFELVLALCIVSHQYGEVTPWY